MHEDHHSATPTLHDWLAQRSPSERTLLARLWSLPPDQHAAPEALAAAMQQPAVLSKLLARLGPREQDALQRIQAEGGVIATGQLEREFGRIRLQGEFANTRAFLLALEGPASPTERLWTLGLLQRITEGARYPRYAIPHELLELLPPVPLRDRSFHVAPDAPPPKQANGDAPRLEQFLLDLIGLAQQGKLEVIPKGGLNKASLLAIGRLWGVAKDLKGVSREEYWPYISFLRNLAVGAGLLRNTTDAQLRPTRVALEWMRQPLVERTRRLLNGWVASDWDELTRFVGLKIERAYWRDLPATKHNLLRMLGQLPPGEWISYDALVGAIKQSNPDFARPNGDYDSWHIVDHLRQPRDGFDYWEAVEGEQIRSICGGTLHWLGLTDQGGTDEQPTSFRINALGAALLCDGPVPALPADAPLTVQPDFSVVVPADAAPFARFQIGRIAERTSQDTAALYTLTRRSIQAALDDGIDAAQITTFLEEYSGRRLPQNVAATLRDWSGQHGQVSLRHTVLLETGEPAMLVQLQHDKRIKLPQAEQLTPTTLALPEGDAPGLAERLRKAGYGLASDIETPKTPLKEHDLTMLLAALEFYDQACAMLGTDSDVTGALRQRVARLLPEQQRHRAYRSSADALSLLRQQLGLPPRKAGTR